MPAAYWDDSPDEPDDDYPDVDDWDDDSSDNVVCPECGADVYEDADMCQRCGRFLIRDTSAWSGKSLWWIALGVLGTIAVIAALALGILIS